MPPIASLLVRIGAQDKEIQSALASIGQKAKSIDADLSKLGNKPIAAQATKSLENLRSSMKEITDAQERIAARAADMASGLQVAGGAGRLMDSQLRQVNKTLQDGLSAYRALGKDAPAELQRVADAVQSKLDKPLAGVNTRLVALGTAIGSFVGAAAVGVARDLVGAAKASFAYADSLSNLSVTTGITVEGLQRLEALGVTSGVSMETLANAVGQLQKKLDDPAARQAIAAMKLNYQDIRKLEPEKQFLEIAKSVAQIQDPVERANAGAALFGKTWSEIAPAIRGDIQKVIDGTKVMSQAQVDALDEAGDAWDQFVRDRERDVARFLGSLVLAAKRGKEINDQLPPGVIDPLTSRVRPFPKDAGPTLPSAPAARVSLGPIVNNATSASVELFGKTLEEQIRVSEAAAAAAEKLKQVQNQLFGRAIIANAEQLVEALGSTDALSTLTAASTKRLHDELGQAIEVYKAMGREVPPKLQTVFDLSTRIANTPIVVKAVGAPSLAGLTKTFITYGEIAADGTLQSEDFSQALIDGQIKTNAFGRAIKVSLQPSIQGATKDLKAGTGEAVGFGDALKQALSGKGFGGLGNALKGSLGDVKKGIFVGFGNLISGGLTSLISKGLGLLTAGLGKLFGKLFGTAGRDAVREFAADEGGFDRLHERLGALGDEGERLWISLTQGVGRNNAEAAKKAIAEVTAALDAQKQKFAELQEVVGTVQEKLTGVTVITPEVQASLDAVFDASKPADVLAAVQKLNTELDKQRQKYNDIQAALDEFGLSASSAGKEFQQAKLNERALDLRKKFDLIKGAGVDINEQMRAMGDRVRGFIKDAQKAGLEVPENMREIIQVAIDAGEVFDADGKKITDINQLGLKFGTTMEQAMQTVATATDRLTLVLEGLAKFLGIELPKAAEKGVDGINAALTSIEDPVIEPRIELPDGFALPSGTILVPEGAARGAKVTATGLEYFAGGRLARGTDTIAAMVSPDELIINAAQQKNIAAALTARLPSIVNELHFDGPILAEDDYVERRVARTVLKGIERFYLREFARLQTLAAAGVAV